ncbi:hypothetical protein EV03_0545 [Prochlorococcus marinus str. PAC1]|uniref:Uncharacterized protein n=1 Tax=Prochlorococcus marinus str. PAC1 TaxID=59924 RepID=A0A0A2CB17_PROMR|nr:hypothetical protein EV03_0545 [Prochlorococcus marinus str. PAC1]
MALRRLRIAVEENYWILSPVLSPLFGRYLIFKFCPRFCPQA